MISVSRIARWCFALFLLTFLFRVGLVITENEPNSVLNFANALFFWGVFSPLLYDWSRSRDSQEDRALFLLELADLLRLSIPLDEAVAKQAEVRGRAYGHRFAGFSLAVRELSARLSAGSPLSLAFAEVSGIPRHWATYTRFCEGPAEMSMLLEQLAQTERSNLRLPFFSVVRIQFLIPFYIGIIVFLTTYILPTFVELFKGMNVAVPLLTRLLIGLTNLLTTLHVGGIVSLLCLVVLLSIPFESVRQALLRGLFYVPGARRLVKLQCQYQAYRLMGAGLKCGVPQSEAVRSAALCASIPAYQKALLAAENAPLIGEALAGSPGLFEEAYLWLLSQGEKLETLPEALLTAAEVASVDLDRRSRRLATSLDTFVLIGIGIFVGFAVLAVFLPLYQLIGELG